MSSANNGTQAVGPLRTNASKNLEKIESLEQRSRERNKATGRLSETCALAVEGKEQEADHNRLKSTLGQSPTPTHSKQPKRVDQSDFFVPMLSGSGTRDIRSIMDIAPFRLSKKDNREGKVIRYDLTHCHVEVSAGAYGMATVWDYDIVLMMVSHLVEAMDRYRDGKGEKPGKVFRPSATDILKFARRGDGSRQAEELEAALARLQSTNIKVIRERGSLRTTQAECLISSYKVLSRTDTKRIRSVEIEAPNWIYNEVLDSKGRGVMTVHPDYFLITSGIGRSIYRLARLRARAGTSRWLFQTVYEHSGSSGTAKKFFQNLRSVIKSNNLPGYSLEEETGQNRRPMLVMTNRSATVKVTGRGT